MFFERVARRLETIGRPVSELGRCWPELRALIHGGIGFAPYAGVFDEWLGRRLERVEVYPAAEAFVAVQTERTGGLTLMLDYDVFYEFVPVEDLGRGRPRRHAVADVELNRHYAVFVTTSAGLWSYALGDTVRFTHREPLRLVVTGRTRHALDAFGERVIAEEMERALLAACRRTEAEVVEYVVAPRFPGAGEARGGHEWLIEFRTPPREPEEFGRILDETLSVLNADYRAKRREDVALLAPRVTALPGGAFLRWMRAAGKLGDPHKVPRLTSTRAMAEALLAAAGGGWPLPSHAGAAEPSRNGHVAATGRG